MTSSTRCSSSRGRAAAVALVATALLGGSGCGPRGAAVPTLGAYGPGNRGALPRVVLLPIQNLAATAAPTGELLAAVEAALAPRLDLVTGDELEPFLARHRLRNTGGIDKAIARAARNELGADAVLITTLEVYRASGPPALGLTMRLVSVEEEPTILWMDSFVRTGDQSPGLLRLGIIERFGPIRRRVLSELARGLTAYLDGRRAESRCDAGIWHDPKVRYRSPLLADGERRTLAVVPFLDLSPRRGAGDTVALEFVRQLVASGRFRVLEPGVVRDYLLRARVIMPGGVSLETTRLFLGALGAEMVLSGVVLDFEDGVGDRAPGVRFSATLLDGGSGDVIWSSSSFNRGDDGVFLFGLGRVGNSQDLTCRMVTSVMEQMRRPGARGGAVVKSGRATEQADPRDFARGAREAREARIPTESGSGSGAGR
jgi:hypothetical protein